MTSACSSVGASSGCCASAGSGCGNLAACDAADRASGGAQSSGGCSGSSASSGCCGAGKKSTSVATDNTLDDRQLREDRKREAANAASFKVPQPPTVSAWSFGV
jgi:hypothetical protein